MAISQLRAAIVKEKSLIGQLAMPNRVGGVVPIWLDYPETRLQADAGAVRETAPSVVLVT
jgi:hypothetical protein